MPDPYEELYQPTTRRPWAESHEHLVHEVRAVHLVDSRPIAVQDIPAEGVE